VPAYLSEQWLEALRDALRAAAGGGPPGPAGEPATGDPATGGAPSRRVVDRLVVGQVVTGIGADAGGRLGRALVPAGSSAGRSAGGEVRYTVALGGGIPPEVAAGTLEGAQVVLVTDYSTARAIATGDQPLAGALVAGRVKVRGDANALIAAQELLAGLGSALAGLAASTQFETG
jgi:hypothetical protein